MMNRNEKENFDNLGDFKRSMRGQKLSQLKDAMYSILRDMKGEDIIEKSLFNYMIMII